MEKIKYYRSFWLTTNPILLEFVDIHPEEVTPVSPVQWVPIEIAKKKSIPHLVILTINDARNHGTETCIEMRKIRSVKIHTIALLRPGTKIFPDSRTGCRWR